MLRIMEIDEIIDKCLASNVEKQERLDLLKECDDLTNLEDMDMVPSISRKGMLLEDSVSNEEVKAAIWDGGLNIALDDAVGSGLIYGRKAHVVKAIHGDDTGMELKGCKFPGIKENLDYLEAKTTL
ncbi:hypothetical protein Tco_0133291 [Tanacetum coccineum]